MSIFSKITYRETAARWRRAPSVHPAWCAADHQCTARDGNPAGEHRRTTVRRRPWGPLIITRIASRRRQHIEVIVCMPLSDVERVAQRQAERLAAQLDLATRGVLRGRH